MGQLGLISMAMFMGMFPGPLGLAVFVVVKFAGYMLAGLVLKKAYPGIAAGIAKIAAVRTGVGLLLGIGFWFLTLKYLGGSPLVNASPWVTYACFSALRIVIWAGVISLFTSKLEESTAKFLGVSALGTLWSGLLDVAGVGLALRTPGQIPIC